MNLEILQNLLMQANDAVAITDQDGNVRLWNQQAEKLFGFTSEEMIGMPIRSIFQNPSSKRVEEVVAVNKNGSSCWVERSIGEADFNEQIWQIYIIRCIDLRRQRMEELQREARTDSVSGLLNRREFQRRLELTLGEPLTLAIVDIDNFKEINDQFGHWVGDEGIRFLARNLSDLFPTAICIARLGGDEFGVLSKFASLEDAKNQFDDFRKQSMDRAVYAHLNAIPKVSVGVAYSSKSNVSARELLTLADQLMYESKKLGGNRTTIAAV